jgi:hypothetical protein
MTVPDSSDKSTSDHATETKAQQLFEECAVASADSKRAIQIGQEFEDPADVPGVDSTGIVRAGSRGPMPA